LLQTTDFDSKGLFYKRTYVENRLKHDQASIQLFMLMSYAKRARIHVYGTQSDSDTPYTHVLLQIVRRLRFNLSHYEFLVSALVKGSFSPPLWETTTLHRSFSLSLKCFRTCSVEYVTYARDPSNFACLLRGGCFSRNYQQTLIVYFMVIA